MRNASIIVPIPFSNNTLSNGGIETLTLGDRKYKIKIPSGSKVGQKLRLKGLAGQLEPRLNNGDLFLLVLAEGKKLYQVKRDVHLELPLSQKKLQSGSTERIVLGDKKIDVKVPSTLNFGQKLRLKNLAQYCNGGYAGDIYLCLSEVDRPIWQRWGVFGNFDDVSQRKIGIKFKLPFFEFYGEWVFKTTNANLLINK